MRCPHCAAPNPAKDVCATCGTSIAAPVVQPRLDALVATHSHRVEVPAERMPDLLTTHDEFGDVSVPAEDEKVPDDARRRCVACGVYSESGRSRCVACGQRLG
jgi:hypothetical protein